MKKKTLIMTEIILIFFGLMLMLCIYDHFNNIEETKNKIDETYTWNKGYCIDCGGKLEYTGCGNKYHYKCSGCDKEYTFNEVMSYK